MSKVTHLTLDEGGGLNRRRIHLREISGDADVPLETVGQDLRTARLRRGDDLATVSKSLKIRKDHLEALEEDRLEALPGRTYAIGFVRSYADYLGLDAVLSVECFKRQIAGRDETPRSAVFTEPHDERQLPHGWMIIAIVVLGLIVYGAYRLARSADNLLSQPVAPVPARMVPRPPTAAKPAAKPPVTAAAAPAPAVQTGNPAPATLPANQPAPAPVVSAPPLAVTPAPALPKGHVYGLRNSNVRVILHVLRPAHVLVKGATGTIFINRDLAAGDSYRVPDFVGLTLSAPDGSAVALELDGQPMGVAGKPQQAANGQSLDPQAIVDRYNGGQGR